MKKINLQIGVGLVFGIAALLMAAPQAQAGPPCPKAIVAWTDVPFARMTQLKSL